MSIRRDYYVRNRRRLVAKLIELLPDGAIIEPIGRLPRPLRRELVPAGRELVLTSQNREELKKRLAGGDRELERHLVGLVIRQREVPLFEGYHLYDYGSPNDAGSIVYLYGGLPQLAVTELQAAGVLELAE